MLSKYKLRPGALQVLEIDGRPDMDQVMPQSPRGVLTVIPRRAQLQDFFLRLTGARSTPRVFIAGECLGGGDETEAADKSGKLEALLRRAGAI